MNDIECQHIFHFSVCPTQCLGQTFAKFGDLGSRSENRTRCQGGQRFMLVFTGRQFAPRRPLGAVSGCVKAAAPSFRQAWISSTGLPLSPPPTPTLGPGTAQNTHKQEKARGLCLVFSGFGPDLSHISCFLLHIPSSS